MCFRGGVQFAVVDEHRGDVVADRQRRGEVYGVQRPQRRGVRVAGEPDDFRRDRDQREPFRGRLRPFEDGFPAEAARCADSLDADQRACDSDGPLCQLGEQRSRLDLCLEQLD